jgi:hypothetical protein
LYKENKEQTTYTTISDDIVHVANIAENNKVEIPDLVIPAAFTKAADGSYTETTNDYVTIVLRVYFDGDLSYTDGGVEKAYVRNGSMDLTDIAFGANYAFAVNSTNP